MQIPENLSYLYDDSRKHSENFSINFARENLIESDFSELSPAEKFTLMEKIVSGMDDGIIDTRFYFFSNGKQAHEALPSRGEGQEAREAKSPPSLHQQRERVTSELRP